MPILPSLGWVWCLNETSSQPEATTPPLPHKGRRNDMSRQTPSQARRPRAQGRAKGEFVEMEARFVESCSPRLSSFSEICRNRVGFVVLEHFYKSWNRCIAATINNSTNHSAVDVHHPPSTMSESECSTATTPSFFSCCRAQASRLQAGGQADSHCVCRLSLSALRAGGEGGHQGIIAR